MAGAVSSEAYKSLRAILVQERRRSGLSQARLAERLGKPPSYVAKYELGERRLDMIETLVVLTVLGADISAIVGELLPDLPETL
ncbi:helix-turn-helix domain-containing protein [Wenxinia marina]|uniref:Helix-turn-helix protein n=1 Tax=Wenxinia marina DSM 24838 TaxID=1123501 RepID=A0A0D0PFV7_9RHOB|nr:helix-turn-helix transcriptional regulator [Wenxinia marina]KIQ70196.1 helix-turn-helix protein [Wenxinia marina DSM 24838]GGL50704.1 hypothetical protein GCM10011392_01020 [Wenxinia marina]